MYLTFGMCFELKENIPQNKIFIQHYYYGRGFCVQRISNM